MATTLSQPEGSVVLDSVSWRTYTSLLEDFAEGGGPRLTFDRGTLEIMKKHERLNRVLSQLVEVLAEELGVDMENLGSTTFKREDLERGFEPDSCFYFEHASMVRDKRGARSQGRPGARARRRDRCHEPVDSQRHDPC
jgi:Uma2 family endonuclease